MTFYKLFSNVILEIAGVLSPVMRVCLEYCLISQFHNFPPYPTAICWRLHTPNAFILYGDSPDCGLDWISMCVCAKSQIKCFLGQTMLYKQLRGALILTVLFLRLRHL